MSMGRTLRWLAVVCFLSLPAILWLGRPTANDCGHALENPCSVYGVSPERWQVPLFLLAVVTGTALLLVASRMRRAPVDELP